jgi:uncharacterized membrane protein YphA (DoxX/SURF4 family)/thiol-disulfide isomerase/thioredoxin
MKKINKPNIVLFLSIIIGSIFLLSTIGKYFDQDSFQKTMTKYGLPYYFSYFILTIEIIIAVLFMSLTYLKKTALFSIFFILFMTIINTIGHYYLNIESCECFGKIYFLNPSNFSLFLVKNLILILIAFYIFKNEIVLQNNTWQKRLLVFTTIAMISFLSLKYNSYYIDNYAKRKIGLPITELQTDVTIIKNFDYILYFSPNCPHCIKAIAQINTLKKNHHLNIIGVFSNSQKEKLKGITIEFPVMAIKGKEINNITKSVPTIFKIKNKIVTKILEVDDLKRQNI